MHTNDYSRVPTVNVFVHGTLKSQKVDAPSVYCGKGGEWGDGLNIPCSEDYKRYLSAEYAEFDKCEPSRCEEIIQSARRNSTATL